jgi:hypothetical protein
MRRAAGLVMLAILAAPLSPSSHSDYLSAKRKFDLIESDRLKPGSQVSLSQKELNAWVEAELPKAAPEGVRNTKLELGTGTAVGTALVDFIKLGQAHGKPPGWLMSKLLDGEHPVSVTARVTSGGGRATVEVERVEVGGMAIEGRMLDFLIHNYLLPAYPDAKVGEPFELGHRIERIDVKPGAAAVIIGR